MAAVIILPCLTLVADLIAVTVRVVIATVGLDLPFQIYLEGVFSAFTGTDVFFSLLKSVIFGILIVLVACYTGLTVSGGAESVGRATVVTMVSCTITVIVADGILSIVFYLL
jgi:phospholipid/cholesterol/gamma-HCH transport system permease protein